MVETHVTYLNPISTEKDHVFIYYSWQIHLNVSIQAQQQTSAARSTHTP